MRKRKRAVISIPITIIEKAVGLPEGVSIEHVAQTHEDIIEGVVTVAMGGDGLPEEFLTEGMALPASISFVENPGGELATKIEVLEK